MKTNEDFEYKKLYQDFAKRFKLLRQKLDLNQRDMAGKIGCTNSFISELEKGKGKPSFEFLIKLQAIFAVNLGWLLQGNGNMFLSQGQGQVQGDSFFSNGSEKDVERFSWYFLNSPMFKHTVMGFAFKFLHDNQAIIKQDVDIYKSELEEEKNHGEE